MDDLKLVCYSYQVIITNQLKKDESFEQPIDFTKCSFR